MVIIDWAQAPEGTTHAFETGSWRKVTDEAVYKWEGGGWRRRPDRLASWLATFPTAVGGKAQPKPAPKENPLPDGKVWPEGMTHYSPKIGGLFFNEKAYIYNGYVPTPWMDKTQFEAWVGFDTTIKRFPEGEKPQVKQQPEPKRPVGWWA